MKLTPRMVLDGIAIVIATVVCTKIFVEHPFAALVMGAIELTAARMLWLMLNRRTVQVTEEARSE